MVAGWPLRELLHCYLGILRQDARKDYARSLMMHAVLTASPNKWKQKPKKPELPAILRDHGNA